MSSLSKSCISVTQCVFVMGLQSHSVAEILAEATSIVATVTLCIVRCQVSALYVSDDPPKHLVRICFCKSMPKLEKACDLMEAHFRQKVAA